MNRKVRALAALALAGALAACSDRNAGAPFVPQGVRGAVAHPAMAYVRPIDAGRRASAAPMTAVVVMQYNRQAELDAFTDALAHRQHPRYLTPAQFVARYAPTVAQQQRVIDALRAHGLRIDKTYQNRTILDISGATGAFERYFATEIHDFDQGKYGRRYAEVRPLHVPTEIAPLVKVVDARTVVSMHSDAMILESPSLPQTELAQLPAIVLPHEPAAGAVPDAGTNVVRNPGFESGHLRPWTTCDSSSTKNKATIQKVHPHSGRFDAYAGTYQGQPEPNGLTSVCQIVTIPAGATLTAWTWGISNDHTSSVHQFGGIYNSTTGKPIKTVFITNKNSTAWREYTADLSAYAGQNVYLAFGVIGNGAHRNKTIGQLVDDISLTGASATPPPCTPSTFPNATPTPNAGPDQGWGPQAVANAFYLPANYDYPGACQTAAIVIDKEVNATDLSTYLQQYGIAQTGTVTYELIDSAPAVNDDEGEATLDLETISSLAPAANVIVYVTGDLGDQHIVDAYNQALTDAKATVVNS
ncbi:MAG: hypothetical protein JO277_02485, partial [Candidatus Eremiobacteraeota bacterium]|nr:hypothetical protein [Candidatus Eremiobacteraeota bacterium]